MPAFDTPMPIKVSLELGVGDVRIVASERADTVVTVRPTHEGKEADVRAAAATQVEFDDGRLLIKGQKRGLQVFGEYGSVDVTVELPAGSRLSGGLGVGGIRATGLLGACRLKTGMGDVRLEHTAELEVATGAGRVEVEHVGGRAEVASGSGAVHPAVAVGRLHLRRTADLAEVDRAGGTLRIVSGNGSISVGTARSGLVARTGHGDIRVDEVVRDSVSLASGMGSLEVGVRAGTAARLDLGTGIGRVEHTLTDATGPAPTEQTVDLKARTGMGDVLVRRA
jgi:DUF4097 and DUF4098 domain-containing protein YvlB